jgi:HlyD family secretion protein
MTLENAALLIALLFLAACDRSPTQAMLGTLERDRLELIADAQEQIVQQHVREGARVASGDVLVELDHAASDARLAQARAQASEARARLTELQNGSRSEQIRAARAQLAADDAHVLVESREYERQADLVKRQLTSQSAVDRQKATRDAAIAAQRASAAQLDELVNGTRSEQIDQAREAVASSDATVQSLEIDAARLVVRAPRSGIVDAVPFKLGERPPRGATVIVLLADDAPYARVYMPEPMRAQVTVGTDVRVHVDGGEQEYAGRVRFVSSDAAFTPYYALTQKDRSRLSYLTEVTLTEPAAQELPTGIPVEVHAPGTESTR